MSEASIYEWDREKLEKSLILRLISWLERVAVGIGLQEGDICCIES
jgi:hypothetical protein